MRVEDIKKAEKDLTARLKSLENSDFVNFLDNLIDFSINNHHDIGLVEEAFVLFRKWDALYFRFRNEIYERNLMVEFSETIDVIEDAANTMKVEKKTSYIGLWETLDLLEDRIESFHKAYFVNGIYRNVPGELFSHYSVFLYCKNKNRSGISKAITSGIRISEISSSMKWALQSGADDRFVREFGMILKMISHPNRDDIVDMFLEGAFAHIDKTVGIAAPIYNYPIKRIVPKAEEVMEF